MSVEKPRTSQIIVILLTVATAAIHFIRAIADPNIRAIFILNGLGYLVLVGMLYFPSPQLFNRRRLLRRALMAYTAVTIALYVVWGVMSGEWAVPLGPVDKVVEVAVVGLLWREDQMENKFKQRETR
jgi:hypothetical protein